MSFTGGDNPSSPIAEGGERGEGLPDTKGAVSTLVCAGASSCLMELGQGPFPVLTCLNLFAGVSSAGEERRVFSLYLMMFFCVPWPQKTNKSEDTQDPVGLGYSKGWPLLCMGQGQCCYR